MAFEEPPSEGRGRRLIPASPRALLAGAAAVGIAVVVAVLALIVFANRGETGADTVTAGPTASPATATARVGSTTRTVTPTVPSAGLVTPIPVSEGARLTDQDLAARGAGVAGRGAFQGKRLRIPAIGVDAPFTIRVVGPDGVMPNPVGPEDVVWYDFSAWDGLGGAPGFGGNVVLSGHVDYINYGPGVFWSLPDLKPGDSIQIDLQDGSVIEYAVVFNKSIPADAGDWAAITGATAEESVTLITCTGQFVDGAYTDRQITWGRRVS
jgi:LPXTG-site transpeptidase (sortase) family protein